jgi:hypothetical protein
MTVYLHNDNMEVASGDHNHHRSEATEQGDRTWALTCPQPGCEDRILHDVEHSARHAAGVPQTVDELAAAEHLEEAAKRDVSKLALALGQLADREAVGSSS